MKNQLLNKILAVSLGVSVIFSSCKKDDDIGEPPELPPMTSMSNDLEGYKEEDSQRIAANGDTTYVNAVSAGVTVAFWNTVLVLNLATPVAAFEEAFNHEPEYDEEVEAWVWAYDFGWFNLNKAELQAKVNGDQVNWSMYITLSGQSEFLWYTGTSDFDGMGGTWSLNKSVDDPQEYIDIVWSRTSDEVSDITYTYTYPDAAEGSYIQYGQQTGEYDIFYDVYLAETSNSVEIESNRETKEGHIKSEVYFNDTDWYCWNSSYMDIDCD